MITQSGSVNVRVTKRTHLQLAALAKENGLPMQTILDRAVEAYRRQSFLEALNAGDAEGALAIAASFGEQAA